MSPKVSVLMPSLNVGKYIDQCLASVVAQTLEDIEIICVDAGSTDGTLEVLRDYERRDPRVRVIVSDQKSYGHQMNLGLDAARGTYVGVVETDDWVEPTMFAELLQLARTYDADVVRSNYYLHYTTPEPRDKQYANLRTCAYHVPFCPQTDMAFCKQSPAIWSGIYRRSMLEEAHIRFNETPGASYQDTSFYFMVCYAASSAVLSERAYVHYRQDNEASSINTAGKVYCVCDETRHLESWLEQTGRATPELLRPYMMLKHDKYWWNYRRVAPEFQWEFAQRVREEFLAHRAAGLLDEAYFPADRWELLCLLLDEPAAFFARTCKTYAAYPDGNLPAAAGEAELTSNAALATYALLLDEATTELRRAYARLPRRDRAELYRRLSSEERERLSQLVWYVRDAQIAEMLAPLRHPAAKRAARVVTYPVRKARAFVRKRKQSE